MNWSWGMREDGAKGQISDGGGSGLRRTYWWIGLSQDGAFDLFICCSKCGEEIKKITLKSRLGLRKQWDGQIC